jgi:hypothetical protein
MVHGRQGSNPVEVACSCCIFFRIWLTAVVCGASQHIGYGKGAGRNSQFGLKSMFWLCLWSAAAVWLAVIVLLGVSQHTWFGTGVGRDPEFTC